MGVPQLCIKLCRRTGANIRCSGQSGCVGDVMCATLRYRDKSARKGKKKAMRSESSEKGPKSVAPVSPRPRPSGRAELTAVADGADSPVLMGEYWIRSWWKLVRQYRSRRRQSWNERIRIRWKSKSDRWSSQDGGGAFFRQLDEHLTRTSRLTTDVGTGENAGKNGPKIRISDFTRVTLLKIVERDERRSDRPTLAWQVAALICLRYNKCGGSVWRAESLQSRSLNFHMFESGLFELRWFRSCGGVQFSPLLFLHGW